MRKVTVIVVPTNAAEKPALTDYLKEFVEKKKDPLSR
jgi:hypothetical protein